MDKFEYVKPNEDSVNKIKIFREKCKELNDFIGIIMKDSREKSIAITKLEEVSMWGNKAIVFIQ